MFRLKIRAYFSLERSNYGKIYCTPESGALSKNLAIALPSSVTCIAVIGIFLRSHVLPFSNSPYVRPHKRLVL
jgi:hypothetical protein